MSYFNDFFSDVFNIFAPQKDSSESEADCVIFSTKLKILRIISLMVALTSATSFFVRVFYYQTPVANLMTLILITMVFVAYYVYFRMATTLGPETLAFNLLFYLAATARSFQGGGVGTPVVFVYVLFCFCGFAVYGKKAGLGFLSLSALSIAGMFALQIAAPELIPAPDRPAAFEGFLVVLIFAYNVLPMIHVFEEKDALLESLRKYEKKESSTVIMRRLTHEIGNSLNIAMGKLQLAESEDETPDYSGINKKLEEIDKIVKGLAEHAGSGTLVEFLNEHENETRIINQVRDSK